MNSYLFKKLSPVLVLAGIAGLTGCKTPGLAFKSHFSHFVGIDNFSVFSRTKGSDGATVLTSREIDSPIPWNELIVSWNANAPAGTYLMIEASAILPGHVTKFYTLGRWSLDARLFKRTSVGGQKDGDGDVDTDTLVLRQLARSVRLRITLGGTNGLDPALKFLGVSFSNTRVHPAVLPPNRAAWGKIIPTPERSQFGYPNANGWCSPTSLSMVLARWAEVLGEPQMNLAVPEVAARVYDAGFSGTGNWPFNTAFAGSFPGMRSYVTRFDDIAEVEDWIAAGYPVILSTRWDWLQPGRPADPEGHLVVCIGFTKRGDVVINDPAAHLERGDVVRRIYQRADVIHSWTKSHNAVYLVYPENVKIPANRMGQWE